MVRGFLQKENPSKEGFLFVLSVAKNEFFLILIHIEITSFLFLSGETHNHKGLCAFFDMKFSENKFGNKNPLCYS